jgi:hypothetical protein
MTPAGGGCLLASDRGPVTFAPSDGALVPRPRPGSVTALLDIAARSLGVQAR